LIGCIIATNEDEVEAASSGELQFQAKNIKTEPTDLANDPKHSAAANGGAENMVVSNGHSEVRQNGEEKHVIYTTTYYIGIELAKVGSFLLTSPSITDHWQMERKKLDISYQTKHFKDICTEWQQYNPEMNSLNIVHTRK
jgi:poly(A) polymerase